MMRRPVSWLGHRHELDGQTFKVIAVEPVTFPSGRTRTVLTWSTRCAACGRPFTFDTARKPRGDDLRRLCRRHHITRRDVRRTLRRLLAAEANAVAQTGGTADDC